MDCNIIENRYKILFVIGIIYLIIDTIMGIYSTGLWSDETFSVLMVQSSLNDMLNYGANDVHPLLYYLIYKFFVKLFNTTNYILVGRFVSLLAFYLLCIFNYVEIRKTFNWKVAGIYNLLIFSMPLLMRFSIEIRMYSWALLFITIAYVQIKKIVENDNNLKNWIILTLMAILASYTHYFAAIGAIFLYISFLIFILREKRQLIKPFILSSIACIISYTPWLPFLLIQINSVRESMWIPPFSESRVAEIIIYIFSPYAMNLEAINVISTILGIVTIAICIILFVKSKKNYFTSIGIATFLLVPIFGFLASVLDTPIYIAKYIIPVLSLLWLPISIFLSKINNKKVLVPIICLFLIIGALTVCNFYEYETDVTHTWDHNQERLDNVLHNGDIVVARETFATYSSLKSHSLDNITILYVNDSEIDEIIKNNPNTTVHLITPFELPDREAETHIATGTIYKLN